jgi:hypothetical protein
MTAAEWKQAAESHRRLAGDYRQYAEILTNTARSEETAANACEINASRTLREEQDQK